MSRLSHNLAPWTGLLVGALGWAIHHQVGSDLVIADCTRGGPWLTGGLGLVCGLPVAAAAWISWSARLAGPDAEARGQTRAFAATVSAAAAGIFLFAILLQSLTGFIYPACER